MPSDDLISIVLTLSVVVKPVKMMKIMAIKMISQPNQLPVPASNTSKLEQ